MPLHVTNPQVVQAAGWPPKRIEEFTGRASDGREALSIARMRSPGGWCEPGQRPRFEEITVVVRGTLRVEHEGGAFEVAPGEAVVAKPGEWIRYSTPGDEGAEYVAICIPAFSPHSVCRDE